MKGILFIAFNRPEYFSQVLNAAMKNLKLHRYKLFCTIDGPRKPEDEPKIATCKSLILGTGLPVELWAHPRNRFCDLNITSSINRVFLTSPVDELIVLEDDIVPKKGFEEWMEWAMENEIKKNPAVFSATAVRRGEPSDPKDGYYRQMQDLFGPWGWETTRDKWMTYVYPWIRIAELYEKVPSMTPMKAFYQMQIEMMSINPPIRNGKSKFSHRDYGTMLGWDYTVHQICEMHGLHRVVPKIARAVNVGVYNGAHQIGPLEQTDPMKITSDDFDVVSEFRLV